MNRGSGGGEFRPGWYGRVGLRGCAGSRRLCGRDDGAGVDGEGPAGAVVGALEARPGWLLVFDNAQDPGSVAGMLPRSGGHVLFTSRNRGWGGIAVQVDLGSACQTDSAADHQSTRLLNRCPPRRAGTAPLAARPARVRRAAAARSVAALI